MKSFFRFLTAEYNGYWVRKYNYAPEDTLSDVKELLCYMRHMVFKNPDEEINTGEVAIRENDLRGIGKIAGLFTPYISAESNLGSLVMTGSNVVNGTERSERGLFNMNKEAFDFYRTDTDNYPTDLTTLATERLRASLVPDGAPILGYIAEGTQVFTADGQVIESAILPSPPAGKAYWPYYGKQYLFLAETFMIETFLDSDTYKKLVESFQRIRYNGPSIAELVYLTEVILEDYVYDIRFAGYSNSVKMSYKRNEMSSLAGKVKRFYIWSLLLSMKFKQIYAVEE